MSEVVKKEKLNLKYQHDKESEKVKGIFRYDECPGGTLEFFFRKFKEDQLEKYSLVDGEIYTVPLAVAKHLKNDGWYPIHKHAMDENGKPSRVVGRKVKRFSFDSLEFIDIEDLNTQENQIITVQKV